jgi:probable HAF family extracellular repeat protein
MKSIHSAAALFCAFAALASVETRAAVFYRIVFANSYELPSGVSPDGSAVVTTGHVWTSASGLIPIEGGSYIYSRDISNNGVIVGLIDGSYIGFRTTIGGPIHELGTFPGSTSGTYSDAFAVTPDGNVVVGLSSSPDGQEAFRWTIATGLEALGHLAPGDNASDAAYGVSADGATVAGVSGSAQGPQAFRWTQGTGMVGLGDLPGGEFSSSASAASADGSVIVGAASSALGREAFRWTEASGMIGLGDLPGGSFSSEANATTADGAIVVGAATTSDLSAFIWTATTGMRSLQEVLTTQHGLGPSLAGWSLSAATDVSDDGRVIVGYGRGPSGNLEGFVVVIPEPSTVTLVIAASVSIMMTLRLTVRTRPNVFQSPQAPRVFRPCTTETTRV